MTRVARARRGKRRRNHVAAWKVALMAAAAIILASVLFASIATDGRRSQGASRATSDPISYVAWDGDQILSTAQFEGRPLVVNFWASWCVACLNEIPAFVHLYESYGGKVGFLGLNIQDSPSAAAKMRQELGMTYPVGRDPQGEAFKAIGGLTMPTTVLISPSGEVTERLDGEVSADQLAGKVKQHFGVEG